MGIVFFVLTLVFCSYASVSNLLDEASKNVHKEDITNQIVLAIGAYNDGIYPKAKELGLKILNDSTIPLKEKMIVFEMLSSLAFNTKNKALALLLLHRLKKEKKYIPLEVQQRIFVNLYNTLKQKNLKNKFAYLLTPKKTGTYKIPENLKNLGFRFGVNLFYIKSHLEPVSENKIIFSPKNQTLYEIGQTVDMGADELREANPLLDPFDILKDDAVIVPYRRLIPKDIQEKTIYINLPEKRIYYLYSKNFLITFPIGIGTDNTKSPTGEFVISEKRKNPAWYVPENIRKEEPYLPSIVPPGENNPLGTRAMRLGNTNYLIHGTNKKFGVGLKVSHGCIRMYNSDVEKLFELVKKGTRVKIVNEYVKTNDKYLELHGRDYEIKGLKPIKGIKEPLWEFVKREKRGYAFPLLELLP